MLLVELFDLFNQHETKQVMESAKIAWAKVGNKVVRKYRCTSGKRQGRIVSSPSQCSKPFDLKKRLKLRQTKLAKGLRMKKKAQRTKRRNPASLRINRMNKAMR